MNNVKAKIVEKTRMTWESIQPPRHLGLHSCTRGMRRIL